MELRTFQIDLDSLEHIDPQQLPFDVDSKKDDLDYFARSIIKMGGLLRIPVVERTGIDSYRLVEGHFDYLAYLKAREINPDLPDRMRVFIMEKDNSEPIQTQLRVLRELDSSGSQSGSKSGDSPSISTLDFKPIQTQINSLKLLVETEVQGLKNLLSKREPPPPAALDATQIEQLLKKLLFPLEAEIAALKTLVAKKRGGKSPKPPSPQEERIVEALNKILEPEIQALASQKFELLKGKKTANQIVSQLVQSKRSEPSLEFKSFLDIHKILTAQRLISLEKLNELCDVWD
jgi:hypothetical protein